MSSLILSGSEMNWRSEEDQWLAVEEEILLRELNGATGPTMKEALLNTKFRRARAGRRDETRNPLNPSRGSPCP